MTYHDEEARRQSLERARTQVHGLDHPDQIRVTGQPVECWVRHTECASCGAPNPGARLVELEGWPPVRSVCGRCGGPFATRLVGWEEIIHQAGVIYPVTEEEPHE